MTDLVLPAEGALPSFLGLVDGVHALRTEIAEAWLVGLDSYVLDNIAAAEAATERLAGALAELLALVINASHERDPTRLVTGLYEALEVLLHGRDGSPTDTPP